jgi:hypothetical protein
MKSTTISLLKTSKEEQILDFSLKESDEDKRDLTISW